MFSPDGSQVAFVRSRDKGGRGIDEGSPPISELRVATVGEPSKARLLLRKRSLLVEPSWDPSGDRLAFIDSPVREIGGPIPEEGDKLMEVNADGSCLTRILSEPGIIISGPAWQPGPDRGAGPILC